jgi:hypothetical protein
VSWCFILGKIFSFLFSGGAVVIGMSEIPSWVFYRLSNESGSAIHDQCASDICTCGVVYRTVLLASLTMSLVSRFCFGYLHQFHQLLLD